MDTPPVETEAVGAELTPRQQRFVEEYIIDLNATQAAIRAGYSPKNADVQGPALLGNLGIARAVAAAKEARSKVTGITALRVVAELEGLAFSSVSHYMQNPQTGILEAAPGAPANAMAAVSSVKYKTRTMGGADGEPVVLEREVEFRLWDKPGTLKLAGRHVNVAGFYDKVEVSGPDGGPIPFENLTTAERVARLGELIAKAQTEDGGDQDEDPGADGQAAAP